LDILATLSALDRLLKIVSVLYNTDVRRPIMYFTLKLPYTHCVNPSLSSHQAASSSSLAIRDYPKTSSNNMAPRPSPAKPHLIRDMIESQTVTIFQMAEEAECTKLTIINIRRNLWQFGSIYAPQTRIGRKRTMTPLMIEALCDHISEKPGLYLDEMVWDEFQTFVTTSNIRRALVAKGWSNKSARQ
jgi:hypothetical protein